MFYDIFPNQDSFTGVILYILILFISIALLNYTRSIFVEANTKLIESNPTSISNSAIPKITAILIICLAFVGLIGGIKEITDSFYDVSLLYFVLYGLLDLFWEVLMFVLLIALAGSFLKPQILNVNTVSDSTTAEDIIGIYSIYLKAIVYFSNYLALAFITYGAFYIINSLIYNLFYSDLTYYTTIGLITSLVGLAIPAIAHLAFLALMSINNYLLAILAIPKINKN